MLKFQAAGVTLAITKADATPAWRREEPRISPGAPGHVSSLPAYCRVEGVIDQRTGAEGKRYGIGFALALPDQWNGRFLFQGGGGLNGNVALPLGLQAAGNSRPSREGLPLSLPIAATQGSVFDGSFFRDQQASLDFYYVAIGRVAQLAKEMIASYYGRAASIPISTAALPAAGKP